MTEKEAAVNFETQKHINHVRDKMHKVLSLLLRRIQTHDASKLESPEMEYFTKYTELLAGLTYGSEEYKKTMAEMKPAIDHHYAKNSHHPEHYKNGINDMTLIDLIEMLADWQAATLRHNDGNIRKSLEINAKRFDVSPQLVKIFENTINQLE